MTEGPAGIDHRSASPLPAIFALLAYQGFAMAFNGIGAPFVARSFGLDDAGIATLYACVSTAALGVLALSRLADRVGRRRVLLGCAAATPLFALAAAASRNVVLFALCDVALYTCIGATMSTALVMLAEALPTERRARGQAQAGLAISLGSAGCLLLMPWLDAHGLSWRWLLMLTGTGLLGVPWLPRALPESALWRRASERGATRGGGLFSAFSGTHRRRAWPIVACAFLSVMAGTSADAWSYYHAVSTVGLAPAAASLMVLLAGGVALVGFPVGSWACDRLGRVPTVMSAWLLVGAGGFAYYRGPAVGAALPVLWLGGAFLILKAADNAGGVGFRSATTELLPTELRGTLMGWSSLTGALGVVAAQGAIALLSEPAGGLSPVVGLLALLALPAAAVFALFVDETRGLPLGES